MAASGSRPELSYIRSMKRPGLTPLVASATLFLFLGPTSALPAQPAMSTSADPVAAKRAEELLKRYDRNGDGKLDDDERADAKDAMMKEQSERQRLRAAAMPGGAEAFRTRMIELFDANKDGRLDDDERAAAQKFAAERGFSPNGELREDVIKRFDRNANGRIDDDERPALQEYVRERLKSGPRSARDEAELTTGLEKALRAAIEGNPGLLRNFDDDGDGRLNDREWAAITRRLAPDARPPADARRLQEVAEEMARRRQAREAAGANR